MKKVLLTLLTGLFVSVFAMANNSDLFSYDENQVSQEMSQLQALEDFVAVNPGVTLSNLQTENNALVNDLNLANGEFGGIGSMSGEPALGIPSFLWGCVLSWVGVLVVYLVTDQDKSETKKAFMGCIVGALAYTVFYVIYYFVLLSAWY
jgi:hypothetical protein